MKILQTLNKRDMIKKFLLTTILIVIFKSFGICQQSSDVNSNTLDFVDNKDVLLNRFSFNPSLLTDLNKILVDFLAHDQWIGSLESNNGFFLKGETGLLPNNISLGLLFDYKQYGLFEIRSIVGGVKKGISVGSNSIIDLGINLGFLQSRMDFSGLILLQPDPLIDGKTVWSGFPIIDLGVSYRFKNQNVGLSYKNLIDRSFEFQSSEYELRQKGLIANYQGVYSISDNINIIPEIYGCFAPTDSYVIFVGKVVSYKNFISAGLLYNSNNSYGFLIGGILFKRLKIGYFYDYETDKVYNNQTIGSHGLNLGLILK